jgi:carbonic anhydrase
MFMMKLNRHLRLPLCVPGLFARCLVPGECNSKNKAIVEAVAESNVLLTVARIRGLSPVLFDLERAGRIRIAGCIYELETGRVRFFPQSRP